MQCTDGNPGMHQRVAVEPKVHLSNGARKQVDLRSDRYAQRMRSYVLRGIRSALGALTTSTPPLVTATMISSRTPKRPVR